jgi:hypothetical protein
MRRKSPLVLFLAVVWALFLLWVVGGYVAIQSIQRPSYAVLARMDGYEVREYPAYLAAQVSVKKGWSDALSEGFAVLSDYITGNNISQESFAAARSVGIEVEPESERIAVTAPVITQEKNSVFLVSFILPPTYTSATLPRPNDPEIRIVEVPSAVVAVRMFGGRVDHDRAATEEQSLRELLARDKRVTVSATRLVQYYQPWTPSFLQRNEVLIPIRRGEP